MFLPNILKEQKIMLQNADNSACILFKRMQRSIVKLIRLANIKGYGSFILKMKISSVFASI